MVENCYSKLAPCFRSFTCGDIDKAHIQFRKGEIHHIFLYRFPGVTVSKVTLYTKGPCQKNKNGSEQPDNRIGRNLEVEVGCGTGLNFPLLQQVVGPEGKIIGVDSLSRLSRQAISLIHNFFNIREDNKIIKV